MTDQSSDDMTKHANDAWKIAADLAQENDRLRALNAEMREAIAAIKTATIEGRVCDDVAWFDDITTLHDFCDLVLAKSDPADAQS